MEIETGRLPNGQPFKLCPACRQAAVIDMPVCRRCGFRYPVQPGVVPAAPASLQGTASNHSAKSRQYTPVLIAAGLLLSIMLGSGLLLGGKGKKTSRTASRGESGAGGGLLSAAGIPADQVDQRLLAAGANTGGDLEVSLAWNSYTDLDLEVGEPGGERVHARNQRSSGGGEQDVDMNPTLLTPEGSVRAESGQVPGAETVLPLTPEHLDASRQLEPLQEAMRRFGGIANRAPSRFSAAPVEHIYYGRAPRGTYTVYVSCYSWRETGTAPLPFTIDVRSRGKTLFHGSSAIGPANFCANGAPPYAVYRFARP